MGVYIYKTKPSATAKARILRADTTVETVDVALYEYAYKPSSAWDSKGRNNRMHFKSGAAACEGAYRRSGKAVPALGLTYSDETGEIDPSNRHPFVTGGEVCVYDDYVRYDPSIEILDFVSLPKGITAPPPKDLR